MKNQILVFATNKNTSGYPQVAENFLLMFTEDAVNTVKN